MIRNTHDDRGARDYFQDRYRSGSDTSASLFGGEYGKGRRGPGLLIVERIVSGHGWNGSVEFDETGTRFEFSGSGVVTNPPHATD